MNLVCDASYTDIGEGMQKVGVIGQMLITTVTRGYIFYFQHTLYYLAMYVCNMFISKSKKNVWGQKHAARGTIS